MYMAWWNRKKSKDPSASPSAGMDYGAYSDVGRIRSENEDAYGCFPDAAEGRDDRLFIVADGMGGHIRGREASTTAVEAMQRAYFGALDAPVMERLAQAFEQANAQVYALAQDNVQGETMGTTGTALVLQEGRAYVAHVGDSRAYCINEDESRLLTSDHTMVEQMRREGLLTDQEARTHPRRGTLTRAIGARPSLEVDVMEIGAPRPGDRFLLCTDGLSEIATEELRDVVLAHPPKEACKELVKRANEEGGYDNATALVVTILDASD